MEKNSVLNKVLFCISRDFHDNMAKNMDYYGILIKHIIVSIFLAIKKKIPETVQLELFYALNNNKIIKKKTVRKDMKVSTHITHFYNYNLSIHSVRVF